MNSLARFFSITLLCFIAVSCGSSPHDSISSADTPETMLAHPTKTEYQLPSDTESFLVTELGLSSTGAIQVIGSYRLTGDSELGKEQDEILHVIQKDLFGDRLFWSCLVNLTRERVQVLYRCQKPDEFGAILSINEKSS